MTDRPPADGELARDATSMARGSAIVFAGGIVDRGLRWVTGWALSWWLGPAGLGLYQTAVKLVTSITAFSPLGLDSGIVYFVARHRAAGDRAREKGVLQLGLGLSVASGLLVAAGLFASTWAPGWDPGVREAVRLGAPAVALWTPLLFFVGALRAVKDMRASAIAYQLSLPVALLLGVAGLAGLLGLGVTGALLAFVGSLGVSLAVAARLAWRHHGPLLRDRGVRAIREARALLAFSLPQSLTAAAFKLNLAMDVLMLAWLSDSEQVGLYFVATSLASIGSVPSNAIITMFNPVISELVYAGETRRLDALLKVVTRWLVILALPFYLVLALAPGAVLSLYDRAYAVAAGPLVVLVLGQVVHTACGPASQLIPMSGRSMLNLVNGLVALGLNVALNALLIPRMGSLGAALATGGTLAAWSLWRVAEVWVLLRCFPFDRRAAGLVALATAGAVGVALVAEGWGRLAGALVVAALLVGAAWWRRTPEDAVVVGRLVARLRRVAGR